MPVPPEVLAELQLQYRQRRTRQYVMRELDIDKINHIFVVHSGSNEPSLLGVIAQEFYLDAIDDYLDEWYPVPK